MSSTFDFLNRLHKKPKEVRQHIGLMIAGVVTLIIFLFWIATFGSRFESQVEEDSTVEVTIATPLQTVARSFSIIVNSVKERF